MVIFVCVGSCVFENGVCGWNDESLGSYKWELGSGATPSANTGPSKDHTLNNAAGKNASNGIRTHNHPHWKGSVLTENGFVYKSFAILGQFHNDA